MDRGSVLGGLHMITLAAVTLAFLCRNPDAPRSEMIQISILSGFAAGGALSIPLYR